jgi:hypothetical protein
MTTTRSIPKDAMEGLGLRVGDTLRVLAFEDSSILLSISHEEPAEPSGRASEWLKSAKGSVRLAEGESPDSLRLEFYAGKYGIGG